MSSQTFSVRLYLIAFAIFMLSCLPLTAQDTAPTQQDMAPSQVQDVPSNVIAQGSLLLIQLTDRIDTSRVKTGDRFHARLAEPVTAADG